MNQPKIGVILMLDAKPHILTDTIDSVLNQTYQNWQLLIYHVYDKDPLINQQLLDYVQNDQLNRIEIIKGNKSSDAVQARNLMLELIHNRSEEAGKSSKGIKYFAYQELDTISYPQRFEQQVQYLEQEQHKDISILGSGFQNLKLTGKFKNVTKSYLLDHFLVEFGMLFSNILPQSTIMGRVNAIKKGGWVYPLDTPEYEDVSYDMYVKTIFRGKPGSKKDSLKYTILQEPLVQHPEFPKPENEDEDMMMEMIKGMDMNQLEDLDKAMTGKDDKKTKKQEKKEEETDPYDQIQSPLDIDENTPIFKPVIKHFTMQQIDAFKHYFHDLLNLYPDPTMIDEQIIDTVACLFKMKKDCGDLVVESYDFMEDMLDWFKMNQSKLPEHSQRVKEAEEMEKEKERQKEIMKARQNEQPELGDGSENTENQENKKVVTPDNEFRTTTKIERPQTLYDSYDRVIRQIDTYVKHGQNKIKRFRKEKQEREYEEKQKLKAQKSIFKNKQPSDSEIESDLKEPEVLSKLEKMQREHDSKAAHFKQYEVDGGNINNAEENLNSSGDGEL